MATGKKDKKQSSNGKQGSTGDSAAAKAQRVPLTFVVGAVVCVVCALAAHPFGVLSSSKAEQPEAAPPVSKSPKHASKSAAQPQGKEELVAALQKDSQDVASLWRLCSEFETDYTVQRDREALPQILACYDSLVAVVKGLANEPKNHPRRGWLRQMFRILHVAGDRHVQYAEGRPDRFKAAGAFLKEAVSDEAYCGDKAKQSRLLLFDQRGNIESCSRAHALLALSLRATDASNEELAEAHRLSQKLPYPPLWERPGHVHLQQPGCRAKAFWDIEQFPWLAPLESRFADIQQEFRAMDFNYQAGRGALVELLAREPDDWKNLMLYDGQRWNETICEALSTACGILKGRPELDARHFKATQSGELSPPPLLVNLYRLQTGAKIWPHYGTHSRLVASLGLEVPDNVILRAGDEEQPWREGKVLLFDDAFLHEVQHGGERPRIVLTTVFLHPDAFQGA